MVVSRVNQSVQNQKYFAGHYCDHLQMVCMYTKGVHILNQPFQIMHFEQMKHRGVAYILCSPESERGPDQVTVL